MKKCYVVIQVHAFEVSTHGEEVAIEIAMRPGMPEYYVPAELVNSLLLGSVVAGRSVGRSQEHQEHSVTFTLNDDGLIVRGIALGDNLVHKFVFDTQMSLAFKDALRGCRAAIEET